MTGWTVDEHLRDKPAASVALYRRFEELVASCGPYTVSPSKSSITFKGERRGFAGARPITKGLRVYLDLQRALDDPRIHSVAPYTSRLFVHHLTITSPEQMDGEFAGWVAEAYAVGAGAHLS
ncbi:DUF5655 domain-containing protein [Microbacterium sp. Marseille-Q6965]|uniref:DUF5655 domain-containing protein n=1 Tax=Microbacterium sp. Marseille-Q6965 TaxID=2965072 RepID=UPI0021B78D80|nr:DUF5655 domain-containing protein [Microbacterium sp. Marseille-Q6965]